MSEVSSQVEPPDAQVYWDQVMPIRELTEDEEARLLSQEEVDALPEGIPVMIKWSGGNGPWLYRIGK